MKDLIIRELHFTDWKSIKEIYESGILTNLATFETTAPDWDKWNNAHLTFARIVAIVDNEVIGWAALSPVSNRCVYGGVAEVSVYVSDKVKGRGIGTQLLQYLIKESEKNGIWTLQSGIFKDNLASLKIHETAGFRVIGYRERIGKLNNEWKDTILLEKRSKLIGVD